MNDIPSWGSSCTYFGFWLPVALFQNKLGLVTHLWSVEDGYHECPAWHEVNGIPILSISLWTSFVVLLFAVAKFKEKVGIPS